MPCQLSCGLEEKVLQETRNLPQNLCSGAQDPDWRARESAVLALGAISEGCHRGLVPFMGPMVTMLAPKLSDERPLVRRGTAHTATHSMALAPMHSFRPDETSVAAARGKPEPCIGLDARCAA